MKKVLEESVRLKKRLQENAENKLMDADPYKQLKARYILSKARLEFENFIESELNRGTSLQDLFGLLSSMNAVHIAGIFRGMMDIELMIEADVLDENLLSYGKAFATDIINILKEDS